MMMLCDAVGLGYLTLFVYGLPVLTVLSVAARIAAGLYARNAAKKRFEHPPDQHDEELKLLIGKLDQRDAAAKNNQEEHNDDDV